MSKESEAIKRIQKGLKCTEEEAREIYLSDCAIDKGEKQDFDLTQAQQEVARKFAHTGTRKTPTVYKFEKRERKKNETKGDLIAEIAAFLAEKVENLAIPNAERMISFEKDGKKFELTLIQKRKWGFFLAFLLKIG